MIPNVLFPLSLLIFCLETAFSQQLSGRVIYKASNQILIRIDSADMSMEEIAEANEIMKKPWERDFILTFSETESNWMQMQTLAGSSERTSDEGLFISLSGSGNEILYKNLVDRRYVQEQEFMGKEFLIKDALEPFDWKLENEIKEIGGYSAQKAIYHQIVDVQLFSTDMTQMEKTKDTLQIIAWFTLEIPISNGPEIYQGLPGLILEVHHGGRSYYFQKVEFNPTLNPIAIKIPKKGKVVTREQFDMMQEESINKMNNRYRGKNEDDSKIRIGGD